MKIFTLLINIGITLIGGTGYIGIFPSDIHSWDPGYRSFFKEYYIMVESVYWDFVNNIDSMILSKGIYNHIKIRDFFKKKELTQRKQILELIRYSRGMDSVLEKLVKKLYRQSKRNSAIVSFTDTDMIEFPCHLLKLGQKEVFELIKKPEMLNNYQDPRYWVNLSSKKIIKPKTFDLSPTLAFTTYINSLSK